MTPTTTTSRVSRTLFVDSRRLCHEDGFPVDQRSEPVHCWTALQRSGPCSGCPLASLRGHAELAQSESVHFDRLNPSEWDRVVVQRQAESFFRCERTRVTANEAVALEKLRTLERSSLFEEQREMLVNKLQAVLLGLETIRRHGAPQVWVDTMQRECWSALGLLEPERS